GYQLDSFTWPYKLVVLVLTFALAAASQRLIEDPLRHAKRFKVPWRAFTLMTSSMAVIGAVTFLLPQAVDPATDEDVNIAECTGANAFLRSEERRVGKEWKSGWRRYEKNKRG